MTLSRQTRDGFISSILEAPDDFSNYLIFADFLEENDQTDTAYCYRWMAKHKRHPWPRTKLVKPTFCWVREILVSTRRPRRKPRTMRQMALSQCPAAILHRVLFMWPPDSPSTAGFVQFQSWGAAVSWLAVRLSAYKAVIGV